MRRNCNLELRLCPSFDSVHDNMFETQQKEERQQMTIIYNGKIYNCDVTEIQARCIIMEARREMEERLWRSPTASDHSISPNYNNNALKYSHQQLYSPNNKASMKKSLQTFLQNRKDRIQSSSPYQ